MKNLPVRVARSSALLLLAVSCHKSGGGEPTSQPISTFTPAFALRQDVQLGTGSVTDAEAIDLDGDGLDDIVETDYFDRRVSSALGNPDGSFTPFFALPTPSTPWAIELGDVDGDGVLDFVVLCVAANGGTASVVVYRGLGDGSFVQDAVFALAEDPFDLAVGRPAGAAADHVFVVLPGSRVTLELAHAGPATLAPVATLGSDGATHQPVSAALVDADGDGLLDVVVGERTGDPMLVGRIVAHVSDGLGGFAPPVVVTPIAFYPIVDNVGDVDGDMIDDLAAAQINSDRAQLLLGSPTGLAAPIEVGFTGGTSSILFEDLDGDGLKDVAATMIDLGAVAVRLATGPLAFGPQVTYNVGQLPRSIETGTFGSGPEVDLLCSNIRDVSILHGDGTGAFRGARGYAIGSEPQFLRIVDMDMDGIADVVSVDQFQNKVVFMKGVGGGVFENMGQIPLAATTTETAGYLIIADFDEDGAPDVVTTVNSADEVRLMRNSGSLPFSMPTTNDSTSVGNSPLGLDAVDLDADGHLDIVVANNGDNTIQVLLGAGDGTFAPQPVIAAPFRPAVVLGGDWNRDGHLDVAVSTGSPGGTDTHLLVYRGDGSGALVLEAQQPLPNFASVLRVGDFDEDGFEDIAASQPAIHSQHVLVLFNRGSFVFDSSTVQVGFRMGTIEVFDVDRDGHLDLIVPLRDGELVLALGDGRGGFPELLPPAGEQFPVPFGAASSAFSDVDGDGAPDLLIVSPDNPHLWVALNDGSEE
jgi:hypothetical protein